jgi:hypothetical protein
MSEYKLRLYFFKGLILYGYRIPGVNLYIRGCRKRDSYFCACFTQHILKVTCYFLQLSLALSV